MHAVLALSNPKLTRQIRLAYYCHVFALRLPPTSSSSAGSRTRSSASAFAAAGAYPDRVLYGRQGNYLVGRLGHRVVSSL